MRRPMLRGSLVTVHVILSVAGEALFAVASCAGLMYLIQDGLIRRKKAGSLSRLLPSLGDLDRINHLCLLWGVPLLRSGASPVPSGRGSSGEATGSGIPNRSGRFWPGDVYAFLLHQRLAIGWRGRTAARWSLAVFVLLLVLLMAGMPFFGTLHRFV